MQTQGAFPNLEVKENVGVWGCELKDGTKINL
jgi:hypothetical protein